MPVLQDILDRGLKVIFCGTAAGTRSAERKAYYAGPGNKFWKTLFEIGLTDRLLRPEEYPELLTFGIGLTDIAKEVSGADSILRSHHFDRDGLRERVLSYRPRALAFNGKKAAQVFLEAKPAYGRQSGLIGKTAVYVLPSTSGAANGHWNPAPWRRLSSDLMDAR